MSSSWCGESVWRASLFLVFGPSAPPLFSLLSILSPTLDIRHHPPTKPYNWGGWCRRPVSELKLRHQLGRTLLRQSLYFNPVPWLNTQKPDRPTRNVSRCSRLANPGLDTRKNTEPLKRKPKLFPTSPFIFQLFCPLNSNCSNHLTLFGFNLLFYLTSSTVAMVIVISAFWHKPILSYLISLKPVKYNIMTTEYILFNK